MNDFIWDVGEKKNWRGLELYGIKFFLKLHYQPQSIILSQFAFGYEFLEFGFYGRSGNRQEREDALAGVHNMCQVIVLFI